MANRSGGLRSTASPSTPGVYYCRGAYVQARRGPGPPGAEGGVAGYAEDDDPEPAGVERRTGAGSQRVIQG